MRVDLENVSNGSAVEALWALGALKPKKKVKAVPKTAPKGAVFCRLSQVQRLMVAILTIIFFSLLRRALFELHHIIVTEVPFATGYGLVLGRLDLTGEGAAP